MRITIDLNSSGGITVSGDKFSQEKKTDINELLPKDDPLLNFLKNEVKVEDYGSLFREEPIPPNAPIMRAKRIAEYRGGNVEDYLKLHPNELEQLDIEVAKEHPAKPIVPNEQKDSNEEMRKRFENEQKEIFLKKLPGKLY